jgi:branched-chain amino acid transport system substrate-binding protein
VALLGGFSPPLAISMAQIAEARGIPFVVDHSPIRAFLSAAPKGGWKWSWVVFFDEMQMTQQEFKTMNMVKSNHKVALFTDQEQDGQIMGGLWEKTAPKLGYKVVYHASFPVGTVDYSDFIRRAQNSGADIMISQMIPPDAIALWKQMKALGWKPKAAFMEKAGNTAFWWDALGKAATGTAMVHFWTSASGYPGTALALKTFGPKTHGGDVEIAHCVVAYTAATILFDAIKKAGSTDPTALNKAIAAIDHTYVAGHIKWDATHAATLPTVTLQWQSNGNARAVYPKKKANAQFIYPLPRW